MEMQRAGHEVALTRVPWRHSLRTRLMLWSILTSALLLAGLCTLFYVAIRQILVANSQAEMRSLAAQTAQSLVATLDSVQVSGRTLSASVVGIGQQPGDLRNLLRATVVGDPDIAGAMLIIDPQRLSPTDSGFDWYVRRIDKGFDEKSMWDLGYDYRSKPWYVRTMASSKPWWSEPYANKATANIYFTTYNLPLRRTGAGIDGERIGMVSVDVPVTRLRALLAPIPVGAGMTPALLSPEGLFVVHPDASLRMKRTLAEIAAEPRNAEMAPILAAQRERRPLEIEHRRAGIDGRNYSIVIPVAESGWTLLMTASEDYVLAPLNRLALIAFAAGLGGLVLSVWAVLRYSRKLAEPIEDLTESARHFSEGKYDRPLGHVERPDEVGVMARAFDIARDSIRRQLSEIEEMGAARQKIESELGIARDIQLSMLPAGRRLRSASGLQLHAHGQLEPAKAVGGDFYLFFERDEGSLWFVIGDVSDKGIPAALFMARSATVLETAARLGGSPETVLREASRRLAEGNDACMFATVLCGAIDLATGECHMASAGHEPPVLVSPDAPPRLLPVETGPPLGFEVGEHFPGWRGRLRPDETLLAYTDGVTEAFDPADVAFGVEQLLAALDPSLPADQQCQQLVARVHAHAGEAPQSDDITVLAIRVEGGEKGSDMRIRLAVPEDRARIRETTEAIAGKLAGDGLSRAQIDDVLLIAEEVLCNAFDHGGGREVGIHVEHLDGRWVLEFRDDGLPFDPLGQPEPDLDADILDRPVGGLGVHLIRNLAKEASYRRIEPYNLLRVVLRNLP